MSSVAWTCPYCDRIATITERNRSSSTHSFDNSNKRGMTLVLKTDVIVCPNHSCRDFTIRAALYETAFSGNARIASTELLAWVLKPRSNAKPFPDYVPTSIVQDYEEACMIRTLSPKAAATLARRCLQGIIRDYWNIKKGRLLDEIKELETEIDPITWKAIDSVRSIGNIGAHMEKDINLIIDVEPKEAELLIGLIEVLIEEWYVHRHERENHMQKIIALATVKQAQRDPEVSEDHLQSAGGDVPPSRVD